MVNLFSVSAKRINSDNYASDYLAINTLNG